MLPVLCLSIANIWIDISNMVRKIIMYPKRICKNSMILETGVVLRRVIMRNIMEKI